MDKLLQQRTILITGGTSQLGRALVRKALKSGAEVYFTYFQNKSVAQDLMKEGAKGEEVDLSKTQAIDVYVKHLKGEIKILDALIHNAASVRDHTLQNMTEEEWDEVLSADLKAPYYLTKKTLSLLFKKNPAMPEARKKILMVTSRVAVTGGIGVANYAAAKAGLIGLTKSLAQELGKKRILVNAVNPGFMKSSMTENLPEFVIRQNLVASPIDSWSQPEEVADFLVYLLSEKVSQVTGQVFHFESRKIRM